MPAPTRTLIHNGEELSLVEWSVRTGIPYSVIYSRIRLGWDASRILTTVPQEPKSVVVNGERVTVGELSEKTGLRRTTIYSRLRKGIKGKELVTRKVTKRHNPLAGSKEFRNWLFNFLVSYKQANDGIAPSLQEIQSACSSDNKFNGISISSIKWALNELRAEGLIDYVRNQPRCIKITNGVWSYKEY